MLIARIKTGRLAEGPGPRTVIWFQGCPIRCPGCYNTHLWPFEGGQEMTLAHVLARVAAGRAQGDIGVSLVGGEPLAQPEACAELCVALHESGVHVIVFTGLTYQDIVSLVEAIPAYEVILDNANVLVDGPFIRSEYDPVIAYRGSRNQRAIDLLATREGGEVVTLNQVWDRQQIVTIRPDGSMVMPERLSAMFLGKKARTRRFACGQAPRRSVHEKAIRRR
jgi:anaerobic ribonucleoside-triphosphate reductase activating protein